VVSQQLTATSSRDDVAALDTSGEDDCTAIVKDLQLCIVMVREAVIKLLHRVSSSMLCNSPGRDCGIMRVIPLDRAQVIVPMPALKRGLCHLLTSWHNEAIGDTTPLKIIFRIFFFFPLGEVKLYFLYEDHVRDPWPFSFLP
jgi:hypothetical protein